MEHRTGGRIGPPGVERRSVDRSSSAGSIVAIAINVVLLYVARNLHDWDLLPFLTDDYERVVGPITVGFVVTIVGHVLRLGLRGPRFAALVDGVGAAVGFWVVLRVFQVFPFDFDSGFPWALVVRALLVVALVGSAIGALVAPIRIATAGER